MKISNKNLPSSPFLRIAESCQFWLGKVLAGTAPVPTTTTFQDTVNNLVASEVTRDGPEIASTLMSNPSSTDK